ncbi:hypothetical protein [Micromonospora sp. NPDC006431]|uniref:hypothetical protein n=1 Tax=Micromonospora sp. NPDC006431 TaxID=3364235 RepID=UPI003682F68A
MTAPSRLLAARCLDLADMLRAEGYDGLVRLERTHRRPRTDVNGSSGVELLSGAETRVRVRELLDAATRRCLRLWADGSPDAPEWFAALPPFGRPGPLIRYRTICTPESLNRVGPPATPGPAGEPGSHWRVLPALPLQLAIVDDTAVASVDTWGGPALFLQTPPLVNALVQYFDLLWKRAASLNADSSFGPGRPSPAQLQVIRMAAAGLKDEAIAHALGRSSRWVRRQMELLEELTGATNRLTLGIAAAQRKWI